MKRHYPASYSVARPRATIAPVGEHGFLTPVRATRGCAATWIWTCRCGATVTRPAKSVRKSVANGATPKCSPKCTGAPPQQQQGVEVSHG